MSGGSMDDIYSMRWHSYENEFPVFANDGDLFFILSRKEDGLHIGVCKFVVECKMVNETTMEVFAGLNEDGVVAWMPVPDFSEFKEGE